MSFLNIMLCYYFSLEVVLQGVANNNPTPKISIQKFMGLWTMRQRKNSKKNGKCKIYRYKLQR